MKKIFFFDIDGTLLPYGFDNVPKSTRYAISELVKDSNNEVYIATGKSYNDAKPVSKLIGIDNIFSSNGQVVYKDGEIIHEEYINSDIIKKVTKIAKENGATVGYQGNYENEICFGSSKEEIIKFFNEVNIQLPQSVEEFSNSFDVTQMWLSGDIVNELDLGDDVDVVNWPFAGADIVQKGASKGANIKRHFTGDDMVTYAFGDGDNDIEMFKVVDNAIAMDNASDKVKSFANTITDSDINHGIYNYLVKEELIKPIEFKKLAFLDIDGTLLPDGSSKISNNVVNAVMDLKLNGVEPFICTGRNLSETKEIIELLELDSYITSNGQEVTYKGKTIYKKYMDESVVKELVEYFKKSDTPIAIESDSGIEILDGKYANEVKDAINHQGVFNVTITNTNKFDNIFQVWIFGEKDVVDAAQDYLENKFSFFRWEDTALEILQPNCNKGNGIKSLLNNIEDGFYYTYGFGDGENDLDMMRVVDCSVAMKNGVEALKNISDYVSEKNCSEDGLCDAFCQVGLIRK